MTSPRIATEDYVDAVDAADVGAVPTTRQVNGHALSADVTVTKGDVGLGNVDNTADASKAFSGSQITSGTVADARIDAAIARDSEVTSAVGAEATARDAAIAVEAALARNADNLTSGTVADARIASTLARDSEVTAAVAAEATLARNADNLTSGTVADARIASTIARDSEVTSAVAAEATLARNADNLTSGTVADARVASTIARDSEVTSAVSAEATARDAAIAVEAALARNADNLTSGTVADARVASTIARDSEVAAGYQPLDADLTALGGLDSSTAGAVASDGAGWIKKTYAQFKTALGLAKGDVGLGNVDNTSDATKDAAATTLTNKTLTSPTIGASIISAINWQPSGRLTLTSGTPVTTTDVAAATTVYYTPYRGNLIPLYNGATWTTIAFAEKSLSLSGLTADSNYDIFGYLSSGDLALEALIWSTGTARATALALTNGFYTKSGDQTRLYLGTIRITAAGGACDDTLLKRYVWNNYNRIYRAMQATDSTSHNYQSATIRQWNANTANRVDFVTGLLEEGMTLGWVADVTSTDGTSTTVRASLDSLTSGGSAIVAGAVLTQGTARLRAGNAGVVKLETIATPGYHYLAVTEQSGAANNALFTSVGLYVGTNM